ncbi:MAG: hypothetical protein J5784_05090 [Muribaculaceae bacterium]|nr:hypothetical protein [Muribaculaceae bacterium]
MITSDEFPCLKFGTLDKALRGVEINKEEYGYEVRVCTFASKADYRLFSIVVDLMMSLTNEQGLYENDEGQPITNPIEFFDDKWIKGQIEASLRVTTALIRHSGKHVTFYGLFFPFCIGPRFANSFDILQADSEIEDMFTLQDYLVDLQWEYANKKNTSSKLVMGNPEDKEYRPLSLSIIYAKNKKIEHFDFVSYADVVCLIDFDREPVMIKMEDFWKITSRENFSFMDEYQLSCKKPLKYKTFLEMCEKAKLFQVDDLFHRFSCPGKGYDDKQKTYVLMWNPAISSITMEDHNENIPNIMLCYFNWSVYEYQEAKKGDRFVMVRCGEGKTGIVMSGIFDSNPYQAGDWSGKGRTVFYMDLKPNFIANPEKADIITTDELAKVIPTFNWSGGHSGRLLNEEQAKQLDSLLGKYLVDISDKIDGTTINAFDLPNGL